MTSDLRPAAELSNSAVPLAALRENVMAWKPPILGSLTLSASLSSHLKANGGVR